MKKTILALSTVLLCQTALAKGFQIDDAWARSTLPGQPQSGAFMNITNTGDKDDVLVAASVAKSVAKTTELHTHINENGVMKMREVKDGIPVLAGQTQNLKPGSYHIMFFGLKKPLKEGQTLPVTLTFKSGAKQKVDVKVRFAPKAQDKAHHHGHQHEQQQHNGAAQHEPHNAHEHHGH